MATIVKQDNFILADLADNHNKYWNIIRYDDNSVETQWGRIGDAGQSKQFRHYNSWDAEKFYDSKCREKRNKGYRAQKTLGGTSSTRIVASTQLAQVAKEQIRTNSPETIKLVERLIKENTHNILSATSLTYNDTTGLFVTPLGLVTSEAITEARGLLDKISNYVANKDYNNWEFQRVANSFLNIIPQIIDRRQPSVQTLFPDMWAIQKQNQILDSLEASLQMALTNNGDDRSKSVHEKVFECKLYLEEDGKVYDRLNVFYRQGVRSGHTSSHLRIVNIYSVEIAAMLQAFNKNIGNVMELWHGSRTGNLLSILKSGFVIPPAGSPHCTGRLYGDGVYASDSSTKALNYSFGYWSGSRDSNCFMFLLDMAMGKSYYPGISYGSSYPVHGYDSTFAKGGQSGVINNEMVVYRVNQVNPKYLVECRG